MGEARHTGGPWALEVNARGAFTVYERAPDYEKGDFPPVICQRGQWTHRAAESQANARLIAAGPELLEAARYCLDMLQQRAGDETVESRIGLIGGYHAAQLLRQAIRKATGEAP